jgi:hypothetical protein
VAERYAAAFEAAGLPDAVFQPARDHDQVRHRPGSADRVRRVHGSVAGGHAPCSRRRRAASSRQIERGKDPAYVRPDAPL